MNFSIITASFPIDQETYMEIKQLCDDSMAVDGCPYNTALKLYLSQDASSRGFFILAYDDEQNKLIGAVSAIDEMGLNTYEWSILIDPMYRQIGIDEALLQVLSEAFMQREAEGELVLINANDRYGLSLVERYGYTFSFSEATFEATPEEMKLIDNIYIRPFLRAQCEIDSLAEIFSEAFGDLHEESLELITFNTTTEGRILWVAEMDGEIVGTITSAKEGEVQWITALAVHPKAQGKGIGTALLNWVKDFTLRHGEKKVMLDVEVENERALAVYEKAGFYKSTQLDYFAYTGR